MNFGPFSARSREEMLTTCAAQPLDLVVIGGGITGAGILRDATLRGFRCALFEKDDFASGTSSRSSKLIHGGIRYLETGQIPLVFEGLRERRLLLNLAPQFVKPLSFVFPVYRGQARSLPTVAAGVYLYHFLSLFRDIDRPRVMLTKRTLTLEPMLRSEGLTGSVVYYDGVTDDSALTLATVRSAWEHGGIAVNHAEVISLLEEKNRAAGVRVRDRLRGGEYEIRARWIINATGPWSDRFRRGAALDRPILRPTKGVHLVLDRTRLRISNAIVMLHPIDGRVTFVIPWRGMLLVGTTDTDYPGNPDQPEVLPADVRYLLEAVNHYFPLARLQPAHVVSTFAGVRPLLAGRKPPEKVKPSALSRDHRIFEERPGFWSVAGGKLTSFRRMAEETLDRVMRADPEWRSRFREHPTRYMPYSRDVKPPGKDGEIIAGTGIRWSDIVRAIDDGMAATVEDVLERRTPLSLLDRRHGADLVHRVAQLLTERLGPLPGSPSQLGNYHETIRRAEEGLERS
ncbi:MAG: glycerol-3-phosphate dehydrogenase/oxidase [Pseudomonadota bacterium]